MLSTDSSYSNKKIVPKDLPLNSHKSVDYKRHGMKNQFIKDDETICNQPVTLQDKFINRRYVQFEPPMSISEQSGIDCIDSSPLADNSDRQRKMRMHEVNIPRTEPESTIETSSEISPTALNAIRRRLNLMYGVPLSPPSDFKLSQSAHVYSNNHTAAPSPANYAEIFHSNNALQGNTPTDDCYCLERLSIIRDRPLMYPNLMAYTSSSSDKALESDCSLLVNAGSASEGSCEKAPESDCSLLVNTGSASEGSSTELYAPSMECVKVSNIKTT